MYLCVVRFVSLSINSPKLCWQMCCCYVLFFVWKCAHFVRYKVILNDDNAIFSINIIHPISYASRIFSITWTNSSTNSTTAARMWCLTHTQKNSAKTIKLKKKNPPCQMILNCTNGRHMRNFINVIEQIKLMSVRLSAFSYR